MKILFLSSPKGNSKYRNNFLKIIKSIEELNHKNLVNYIDQKFNIQNTAKLHTEIIKKINKADICIFEVSVQSLGLGHVITHSLQLKKPIIALYTNDNIPLFLSGSENDNVQIIKYKKEEVKNTLKLAIDYASNQQDIRFNMMLSPDLTNYLNQKAKENHTSKAGYIRNLILKDKKETA